MNFPQQPLSRRGHATEIENVYIEATRKRCERDAMETRRLAFCV